MMVTDTVDRNRSTRRRALPSPPARQLGALHTISTRQGGEDTRYQRRGERFPFLRSLIPGAASFPCSVFLFPANRSFRFVPFHYKPGNKSAENSESGLKIHENDGSNNDESDHEQRKKKQITAINPRRKKGKMIEPIVPISYYYSTRVWTRQHSSGHGEISSPTPPSSRHPLPHHRRRPPPPPSVHAAVPCLLHRLPRWL
jgi:hypothetical protein